uniref:3-oxo-5-alpha-steroid 4-dehydrogenase C-terminal domain-containing protein n=1 Tax=Aplanochytrium stocchinoi TaxID=215587 RepID=A0A7S3LKP8_9STRA|mmetsp:Transcript_2465/g.3328  ORF Transcript_2465/g.3328 Transcript_2465/m.3328 type:complete len:283 (+) Transcript_2465:219-1067(+)
MSQQSKFFTGDPFFDRYLTTLTAFSALCLVGAKYQGRAPYGKFGHANKQISLDPRFGWWLMELPATVGFLYGFWRGNRNKIRKQRENRDHRVPANIVGKVFAAGFLIHYANRGWYFPLTIRVAQGGKQSFALWNSLLGGIFVGSHAYLNGRYFSELGAYNEAWLKSFRFLLGFLIYELGFLLTVHSENLLKNLRPKSVVTDATNRYKIPHGGGFEYVTNPQYLGEIMAWFGFVIYTSSPTALPVLLITLANLVPRSFENHKWYLKKFKDYPKSRKVLIPFIL